MTTETQKTYHHSDLIRSIEDRNPKCYPSQVGSLQGTLASVLIHVEVHDPLMFAEIMDFEMRCQERMITEKAMQDLAEADKDLI